MGLSSSSRARTRAKVYASKTPDVQTSPQIVRSKSRKAAVAVRSMHALGAVDTEEYPVDWTAVESSLRANLVDRNRRDEFKRDPRAGLVSILHETQRNGVTQFPFSVPGFVLNGIIPPQTNVRVLEPTTDEVYIVLPKVTDPPRRGRRRVKLPTLTHKQNSPSVQSALGRVVRFGGDHTIPPSSATFAGLLNGKFVLL